MIDLLAGHVVRGMGGRRETYRPIVSALCNSSDPVSVGRSLCAHCDGKQLYVADLDALMGGVLQVSVLRALLEALPEVQELWLDGGFAGLADVNALFQALGPELRSRIVPVFGSESLPSRQAMAEAFTHLPQAVLSLDRRGAEKLDPAGCWDAPALWPQRVIVMTLERVGSGAGPDLQTLRDVQACAPAARLFGAGGLRTPADLAAVQAAGAAGWLVASALHDLQLPAVRSP